MENSHSDILPSPEIIGHMANMLEVPDIGKEQENQYTGIVFEDDSLPLPPISSLTAHVPRPMVVAAKGTSLGEDYLRLVVIGEPFTGNPEVTEETVQHVFYILQESRIHPAEVLVPSKTNYFDKVHASPNEYAEAVHILENLARIQENRQQRSSF